MNRNPKDWNGDMIVTLFNGSFLIYNSINKIIKYKSNPSHTFIINDVKISQDYIASCSDKGDLRIYNIYTNELTKEFMTDEVHNKFDGLNFLSFSPQIDNDIYICGVTDNAFL